MKRAAQEFLDFLGDVWGYLLIIALISAFVWFLLVVLMQGGVDRFTADCHRRGGHIYGDGLWLCLDDEGHVLEARK